MKEAREWYPEQHFTESSHIVKAYRKRFNVDKDCAMRELVILGVLSPEKQKSYQELLAGKDRKKAAKRNPPAETDSFQNETFFFIAGHTSGGAPYGITWDQAEEEGLLEE